MDLGVTKIRHSSTQGGREGKHRKHWILVYALPSNGLKIHNDMLDKYAKSFMTAKKPR
jgi:hypothetical protein